MNEQGNNTNGVVGSTSANNNATVQQSSAPSIEIKNVVQQNTGNIFVEYSGVNSQSDKAQPVSTSDNSGVVQQPSAPSIENTGVVSQQPITPRVETATVAPQQTNTPSVGNTEVVSRQTENISVDNPLVESQSTTNTQTTADTQNNKDTTNKTDINYKPPGVFKTLLLILFFGGLVVFIMFLPEIQEYIAEYGSVGNGQDEITDGRLICTLDTNTTNLDKSFERTFIFVDKKLESATFKTTTKGDITKDEETLDELSNTCKMKKEYVSSIDGIGITCDYSDGLLTEKEHFNYKDFDMEKVKTAYAEAGVDVIEYEYGYDIEKIKTSMLQAGFSCKTERS